MIRILRTDTSHADFLKLVRLLDVDLAMRDGIEHAFYAQYNKTDTIKHALVVYDNDLPVGCGAMKEFTHEAMEIKRMFVLPEQRKKGIATRILLELEKWAAGLNYTICVLETGKKQPEALALYKKNGYLIIPNYGQYKGVDNSVCFEKHIEKATDL